MLPLPPWEQGHRYRWNVHHAFGHGRHAGGHCRRWEGMMTSKSMTLVLAGAESSRCMDGRCLPESAGGSVNLRFLEPRKWDRTRMNKNWWICGTWSWASKCNTCHVNCLLFPLMIWYIMIFIYILYMYIFCCFNWSSSDPSRSFSSPCREVHERCEYLNMEITGVNQNFQASLGSIHFGICWLVLFPATTGIENKLS